MRVPSKQTDGVAHLGEGGSLVVQQAVGGDEERQRVGGLFAVGDQAHLDGCHRGRDHEKSVGRAQDRPVGPGVDHGETSMT